MKITVSGINLVGQEIDQVFKKLIRDIANETETVARKNTPIKTGRARSAWKKTVEPSNFKVENRVPYIERLEAGASKQAPKGIIGPTLTQIKGRFK